MASIAPSIADRNRDSAAVDVLMPPAPTFTREAEAAAERKATRGRRVWQEEV